MSKTYTYITKSFAGEIKERDGNRYWEPTSPFWYQHELRKYQVGDKVTCYYTNEKPKRTEQQNRYYWLYLNLISTETGNDIDDLHTLFKGMFLSKGVVEVLGHKVRQAKSTTELNVSQFTEYIQRIEELTGVLAPPTEDYVLDKKEGEEVKEIAYPEYQGKSAFDD